MVCTSDVSSEQDWPDARRDDTIQSLWVDVEGHDDYG